MASPGAAPADGHDAAEAIADAVRLAVRRREPLRLVGGGTRQHLGRPVAGRRLELTAHHGVVHYEPAELVLTARAGTRLDDLVATLARAGQHLPFDPPRFAPGTTLGGAIATGLSGPARPFTGSARDFVLGIEIVNGRGQRLRFGGEVMKNVAGYDLARLLTGSFGTLGVILQVSLKVLPAPRATRTLHLPCTAADALRLFATLRARPLPLAGACHHDGLARVRLAGSDAAVAHGCRELTTRFDAVIDERDEHDGFWAALRDHRLPFFDGADPRGLYRLAVPPASAALDGAGECLIDWAGGQRWLLAAAGTERVRGQARARGGHATRYRAPAEQHEAGDGTGRSDVFHPLAPAVFAIHQRLKAAFDPHGVLNPGRQYPGL